MSLISCFEKVPTARFGLPRTICISRMQGLGISTKPNRLSLARNRPASQCGPLQAEAASASSGVGVGHTS
jgi:hypothetical protein